MSARPPRSVADVWRYRELLVNLVRKELKVKYKNSALGFVWSLLNPMLYLVVFYIVFTVHPPAAIPYFPIFLLAGLLPYNLFSAGLGGGTTSIVGNAEPGHQGLVPPRDPAARVDRRRARPLRSCSSSCWSPPSWCSGTSRRGPYLPLIVPGAAHAARARRRTGDRPRRDQRVRCATPQHLLELVLLAWFWMTPIVYAYAQVRERSVTWAAAQPAHRRS